MNPLHRATIAEVAIAVAVCAAAQLAIVEPAREAARKAADRLSRTLPEQDATAQGPATPEEEAAAALAARLQLRSIPARDENALFNQISQLATQERVSLESMGAAQAGGTSVVGAAQVVRSYTLSFQGAFPEVTAFIRALEGRVGLLTVSACEMRAGDPERPTVVQVRLVIDLIDASTALAAAPQTSGGLP